MVKEKTTDDLRQELMTQPDIDSYIKENQEFFCDWSVSELLGQLYEKSGLSKAGLARKAGMSEPKGLCSYLSLLLFSSVLRAVLQVLLYLNS